MAAALQGPKLATVSWEVGFSRRMKMSTFFPSFSPAVFFSFFFNLFSFFSLSLLFLSACLFDHGNFHVVYKDGWQEK